MTNMIDRLYFNNKSLDLKKEFKNSLKSFVAKKNEGFFIKEITKTFAKFENLLEKRFVPLEDESCFDTKVKGCWPYLCKENYGEYKHLFTHGFNNEQDIKVIYDYFKDRKFKIDGKKWDIPTKEELLVLTKLENIIFITLKGTRPKLFEDEAILYKYNKNSSYYIKGYCTDGLHDCSSMGHAYPISRLSKDKTISNRKIFQLFIEKRLKPVGFDDELYTTLL